MDIANQLKKYNLKKNCHCHLEERIQLKYFVMGLNLLLMLMVATSNDLISFKILEYLDFAQISMIAVFLPFHTRNLLATSNKLLKHIITSSNLDLNPQRLSHCLKKSKKSLFYEYLALKPFTFKYPLGSLAFTNENIKLANFNPCFPIVSIVTMTNIMFVYCYGERKKSKTILFHQYIHDHLISNISWSPNGQYFYAINYTTLNIYMLNRKSFIFRFIGNTKLKITFQSNNLWLAPNEILVSEVNKSHDHLSKIVLKGMQMEKCFIKTSVLFDQNPFTFEYLNNFQDLTHPIFVPNITDYIFFKSVCPFLCHDLPSHSSIILLNVKSKKIEMIIHCPGNIVALNANDKFLVFCFIINHNLYSTKNAEILSFPQKHCPFTQTEMKNKDDEPFYSFLQIGIYDGTNLQCRTMNKQ